MKEKDEFKFGYEDLERIFELVKKSDFDGLQLIVDDLKLVLRKRPFDGSSGTCVISGEIEETSPLKYGYDSRSKTEEEPEEHQVAAKVPAKDVTDEEKVYIRSPIMGTFYRAPGPGAPPFVEIGDMVSEDMTVCMIEVMKVIASVNACIKGRISEILVENAELVEYDQPLFLIDPDN